jgi:hypothetical protein
MDWVHVSHGAAAVCIRKFTSGPISCGVCPWSLQIRYAGQGLLIQIAVDALMNHELTRRPTLDCADLLANGSEQQLFSNVG